MPTERAVQHVDFTLKGWKDGAPDANLEPVTIRGSLEYRPEDVVTDEAVRGYAFAMVRRHRSDLPDEWWDQPLEFTWTVTTLTEDELSYQQCGGSANDDQD